MDVRKVIVQLEEATKSTRFLDSQIAQAIGWKKEYGPTRTDGKPQILWFPPNANKPGRFPNFTSDLDHTYALATQLARHAAVACSWSLGGGKAVFEGMNPSFGATPHIALCIASLIYLENADRMASRGSDTMSQHKT